MGFQGEIKKAPVLRTGAKRNHGRSLIAGGLFAFAALAAVRDNETIAGLARKGMAVIVVSSDLEEVMGLSHRVLVLARGRPQGILPRGQASNVAIMERATA